VSGDAELFRREVDDLDTGLPAVPDLTAVRSAVRRRRRRRRTAVGAAAGAGALVVALGVVVATPDDTIDHGVDLARPAADPPTSAAVTPEPGGRLAGPWFGPQVEAAVAEVLPGLVKTGQLRGDHYEPLDRTGTYPVAVATPVRWATFFQWTTFFDGPDGVRVDVSSTRDAPDATTPDAVTATTGACRAALYPVRASCRELVVDGRTVVVSDGIRFERSGVWHRQVEVRGPEGVRGMDARVLVLAFGEARSRAEADAQLPSLRVLQRLALDPDLVLPEPRDFPEQFPD
jgi:hypothetical protein